MMEQTIATFEKVSFEQYWKDQNLFGEQEVDVKDYEYARKKVKDEWEKIQQPKRATSGSAGYDFMLPYDVQFEGKTPQTIPTGIRCKIEPGWMLALFPRSGLGFKAGMMLKNTVGIIDSDYYHAKNEGHIMAKIDTDRVWMCNAGDKFMQGVFIPYGITVDDEPQAKKRHGGLGSTGR